MEPHRPLRPQAAGVSEHRTLEGLSLAVELYAHRGHGDFVTEDARIDVLLHTADRFSDWLHACPQQLPDIAGQIVTALSTILTKQEILMTQQSDIDAATAALTAVTGDVATNVAQLVNVDVPAIQAALAALPQSVDTTALDAAVAAASGTASSLDTSVSSVTALTSPPVAGA